MQIIEYNANEHFELARNFKVSEELCKNPDHYNSYLTQSAFIDKEKGLAVTYIMIDDENSKIVGFLAIKTSSLISCDEDSKWLGEPAIEISELAVSKDYAGQGYGTQLVMYGMALALQCKSNIGVRYVIICADPMAVGFYKNKALKFTDISSISEIPREDWNKTCIPLLKKL